MAVLLRTPEELYPVLASFYALGAKRGGWIVHRSRPGEVESDRAQLVSAGLNVAELEAAGTLSIVEFDMAETPEQASTRWLAQLDAALAKGFTAMWYSRFVIVNGEEFTASMAFDEAWDRDFSGRAVVTLCPYIAGSLSDAGDQHLLDHQHDDILITGDTGITRQAGRRDAGPPLETAGA